MRSDAAPASAPGVATPSVFRQPRRWRWLPRHPTRATSAALLRLGRATRADSRGVRPLLRAPALANRPPPVARSAAPVAAAAPAVGSWQRCLRSTRSGTAAIQQQLPDSARGRAPPCTPRCAGGKLPAAAAAVVPLPRLRVLSAHNVCYTQPGHGCALRRITFVMCNISRPPP